jgi:hypothetical protein
MTTAISALLGSGNYIARGVYQHTWSATISGRGNPLSAANLPDKTVQITGPTGGTSRVILEGSNGAPSTADTATWITMRSVTDGAIDTTNATGGLFFQFRGNPRMIRPHFDTVTTGKTLSVIIVAK